MFILFVRELVVKTEIINVMIKNMLKLKNTKKVGFNK